MFGKLKENKEAILFLIISAVVLSFSFYFGVVEHKGVDSISCTAYAPEEINAEEIAYEETTVLNTTTVSSTTETTTEITTIVQIDDTPGTIEVPNLVPAGNIPEEEIEFTTEERSEASTYGVCTFSVSCDTILNNKDKLDRAKESLVPSDGEIYKTADVEIKEGDTVFSLLERELVLNNIHFEYSKTTNVYIEGINNIYEFDCGELSGWMYRVNGVFPSVGCDQYTLKPGDVVEWVYTCDLGRDVGDTRAVNGE